MRNRGLAVVTGASAGIGEEFARQLAARGFHLLLVARREDRLRALAEQVAPAAILAADLTRPEGVDRLLETIDAGGHAPALLVNNAGRGYYGAALDEPGTATLEMLRLNIEALTRLSLEVGRRMAEQGSGGVINIASTAAYQPVPYLAVYAATKAYVASFSEALAAELVGKGVRVFTVSPGATRSEFASAAGLPAQFESLGAPAADVVRRALDAYEHQVWGDTYIDGALNQAGALLSRFAPRFLTTHFAAGLLRAESPVRSSSKGSRRPPAGCCR
jgi:short-subunit dehydrogenase